MKGQHDTTGARRYEAALDTAGAIGGFALRALDAAGQGTGAALRLDLELDRKSVDLLPRLLAFLDAQGVSVGQIDRWTVGMGPGSFTGIRVGAALVLGLTAGRDVPVRGLPSGMALLRQATPQPGQAVAVLNDGRRQQVIVACYRVAADGAISALGEPEPWPIAELAALRVDRAVIRAADAAAAACAAVLGERLLALDRVDASLLLDLPGQPWAEGPPSALDPVYVRPAVHVAPMNPAPAGA